MPFDGRIGPVFLAGTPPAVAAPPPRQAAWPRYWAHYVAGLGARKAWRYTWWAHWARLAEFILPYRYKWLVTANSYNRGLPVNDRMIDETALLAMQICGNGLLDGLMSQWRPWFKIKPGDAGAGRPADAAAIAWAAIVEERLYAILAGSNFYPVMGQAFRDVATFGTAPVHIMEDFEDVIRLYLPCAGEYYLGVGARLSTDTFEREFTYTVKQIVDRFRLENCPPEIREHWKKGGAALEREYVVIGNIEPNFPLEGAGGTSQYLVPRGFTWRSVYYLRGLMGTSPLEAKGDYEQPFVVLGWSQTSNDPYYRGPGMDALAATRQLQKQQVKKALFIDKSVDPPMGADPSLQNAPKSILAGEVTFVSAGKTGFYPLIEMNPAHLPAMTLDIKEVQTRIERCFRVDVFKFISQMQGVQPKNELELNLRKAEQIQQLGPIVGLFETAAAPLIIHRVLSIMQRRRLLPPPPPSLRGQNLAVEFISMMRLVQEAAETASLERGFAVLGKLSEAAKAAVPPLPDPIRTIKLDDAWWEYADKISFPLTLRRPQSEVAAMDAAMAKAAQQHQAAQTGMAAVSAAQGLSNTQVGGGRNAIEAMLTGPGGGGEATGGPG